MTEDKMKIVAGKCPIEAGGNCPLRPQGKWNYIQAGMAVCPFCGAMPHKEYKNFCAKCGADMRGGEE